MCFSARAGYITRWIGFGADSLWTNPTNWDRLAVPDANSDVIITNTGGKHVVLNVDTTVASVTVLGGSNPSVLDLVGVNLHADGASLIASNATIEILSNSTFSGAGSLQNSGTIKVPAGSGRVSFGINCNFTNSGVIDIETNSTLELPDFVPNIGPLNSTVFDSATFAGPGTVRFVGNYLGVICFGPITVEGNVEFQRQTGLFGHSVWTGPGLFRWQAGAISGVTFAPDFHTEVSGTPGMSGDCTNQGSMHLIGSIDLTLNYGTFHNDGLFQIESNCSLVGAGGDFENSGTILLPANLGTQTLAISCSFMDSGIIDVETNSTLELPDFGFSALSTVFDSVTFAGPGTVRFVGNNTSVECYGPITVEGTVEYRRATGVFGHSFWTGPGLFRWQGGAISGVTFAPDFHTEVSGPFAVSGDSTNQGSMHLLGTNDWYMNGTFYNSGLFQIETNCAFEGFSPYGGFDNSGTILLPAGLGSQTVSFNCNFTNSGIIDVGTNSILDLPGFSMAQFTLLNGTTFAGPGTIRFSGTDGGIECDGLMTVDGTIEFQRQWVPIYGPSTWTGPGLLRWTAGGMGGATFAPDFHVEMSGLQSMFQDCTNQGTMRLFDTNHLYLSYGTFHNNGLFQLETNCTLEGYYGNIENSGTIKLVAGRGLQTLTLTSCMLTNYGTIDVGSNSTLTLTGSNNLPSDVLLSFSNGSVFAGSGTLQLLPNEAAVSCLGTMNVSNTVEFKSQSIMYGLSKWTGPGLLRWLNGGIVGFTFAPDFHTEISGPDWKFLSLNCTNQGTLRWLGGGNLAGGYLVPEILHNEGLVQVETDGFWWDFPLINEASGTFRQLGGTLTVDSFANNGTARLESGKLNVQKTFSSDPNSVYQVLLSGTTPITNFNQLNVTSAALGGSLQVMLTNGYSPANGDTFTIANNASQSGIFNSVTVPTLQSNLAWQIQYQSNSVVLEVVGAVPPTVTGAGLTNGQFQFSFTGNVAAAYDVQVSTNLTDWTTIQSNSPFSGSVFFTDTNSPNFDHLYYRCRIFN